MMLTEDDLVIFERNHVKYIKDGQEKRGIPAAVYEVVDKIIQIGDPRSPYIWLQKVGIEDGVIMVDSRTLRNCTKWRKL